MRWIPVFQLGQQRLQSGNGPSHGVLGVPAAIFVDLDVAFGYVDCLLRVQEGEGRGKRLGWWRWRVAAVLGVAVGRGGDDGGSTAFVVVRVGVLEDSTLGHGSERIRTGANEGQLD